MPDYIEKYHIKMDGLTLENENPEEAIKFYKDLLNDELFINDYYPYRRLVLMYKKTKKYNKKVNVIRCFFKSGIYCNRHNYLWFRNKLRKYSEKGYITKEEIVELTNYYKNHGCNNKNRSNIPVPIADRIIKKRGEIVIDSQQRYDRRQKAYEFEEEGRELKRQGKIQEFIKLYNHMIDELGFRSYTYFQALCIAYRQTGDLDNELRIIDKYFNGESTRTKISNDWFEKREKEVLSYLGIETEEEIAFDKLFNDNAYMEVMRDNAKLHDEINILKKQIETLEKRISRLEKRRYGQNPYKISSDIDEIYEVSKEFISPVDDGIYEVSKEFIPPIDNVIAKNSKNFNLKDVKVNTRIYDYEIPISKELEDDLRYETELFEYDESLDEVENILRKYSLKKRGLYLHGNQAISYFKSLIKNSYFENDWYPYRQLTIRYDRSNDYESNLNNIKEMFHSGVYLNNHQYVWFTNKLRKISEHIKLDESQVNEWIEYYNMNGAKNMDKIHKPIVNADRMTTKDNTLKIFTEEHFDIVQTRYELREICRSLESIGNYQKEFDVIKQYYNEYPNCRMNKSWYNDKLKKINNELKSFYKFDDLLV